MKLIPKNTKTLTLEISEHELACIAAILGEMKFAEVEAKIDLFLKHQDEDTKNMCDTITNNKKHPFNCGGDFFDAVADYFVDL